MRIAKHLQQMITFIILSCIYTFAFCQDSSIPTPHFFLNQPEHHKTTWSITGILRNEQDEPFGFNFSLYRLAQTFYVTASIIDLNQQKLLWQQVETRQVFESTQDLEKVGSFFWHFSPINASLIVGYEDHKKQIFNLKFDLLEPATITPTSSLTKDLKMKQYWSGHLNGHIHLNEEEQFVSSQGVWLQEIWQDEFSASAHPFQELLCKFHDGSSLFAIQVHEKNALRAAYAGRFDAQGNKQTISQFLDLNIPQQQAVKITIDKTQESLLLNLLTANDSQKIFASTMPKDKTYGICMYQSNPWIKLPEPKPPLVVKPSFLEKTLAFTKKPFKIPYVLKNKFTS